VTAAYEPPPRDSRIPALAAAAALHAGLLALVILLPTRPPPLPPVGSSVPINIVSSAPFTDTRAMTAGPQTQLAQTPTPQPKAEPQPSAPVPAPPHFGQTSSTAKPTQKPPPPPSQHAQAPPVPAPIDFASMQRIIDRHRAAGGLASNAQPGPPRLQTGPQNAPSVGQGLSESDRLGLAQLLERLWRLNCDVPGIAGVNPQVKFTVGLDGRLVLGPTVLGGLDRSPDAVVSIGARQALDAVRAAAPFAEPYYGQTITVNFNAKEACSKR